MCAFLACLFYAIFCLMFLQGVIAIVVHTRLRRFGISLEVVFGKKVAEAMNQSTNVIATIAAVSYFLYVVFWHYA